MNFRKRKMKREIAQINNDYLRACAALGEKTHALAVTLPREIKRLQDEISALQAEAESLPREASQPEVETKEEES